MQNNDENKNIGRNIRLYRIRAGLTIRDLSKRIARNSGQEIKTGSIRNYEKGTEKIPAVALHAIATATDADIHLFYETANISTLIDSSNKIHLLEAYSMIRCRSARESLLHLARKLGKRAGGSHA